LLSLCSSSALSCGLGLFTIERECVPIWYIDGIDVAILELEARQSQSSVHCTAVLGGINIVSMLCSNIYSATRLWTNAKHRGIYQAVSALVVTMLAIISVIFISVDIQPCGYTYCTARSRYMIPIIPLLYVSSYLGMWTYTVWKFVNNQTDGRNKSIKQVKHELIRINPK
jgi:hypothetical protein